MDLTTLTVTELEALAYRLVVQSETARQNLAVVQQELTKRQQAAQQPSKADEPKPE